MEPVLGPGFVLYWSNMADEEDEYEGYSDSFEDYDDDDFEEYDEEEEEQEAEDEGEEVPLVQVKVGVGEEEKYLRKLRRERWAALLKSESVRSAVQHS